jgi:hypothetical protein
MQVCCHISGKPSGFWCSGNAVPCGPDAAGKAPVGGAATQTQPQAGWGPAAPRRRCRDATVASRDPRMAPGRCRVLTSAASDATHRR